MYGLALQGICLKGGTRNDTAGERDNLCHLGVLFNHANVLRRRDLGFFNKRGKYRWCGVYYLQALDNQESLLREIDDAF